MPICIICKECGRVYPLIYTPPVRCECGHWFIKGRCLEQYLRDTRAGAGKRGEGILKV